MEVRCARCGCTAQFACNVADVVRLWPALSPLMAERDILAVPSDLLEFLHDHYDHGVEYGRDERAR
jgi:hypothetical protein